MTKLIDFAIEKDIPLPQKKYSRKRESIWQKMEVGDSIKVPNRNAYSSAIQWNERMRLDYEFTCRQMPDGSFRIWRIK